MSIGKRLSLAAMVAAFGMAMMSQGADAAPLVTSVKVISPDSGTVVGIDGTISVEVKASVLNPPATFTALVWLVSDGARPNSVLFDNTATATTEVDNLILAALATNSALDASTNAATHLTALRVTGRPLAAGTGSDTTPIKPSFIAARQQKTALALGAVFGDANTAAATTKVATSGNDVTFTIGLKIPASAGEDLTNVRVMAIAYDPTAGAGEQYSEDATTGDIKIMVNASDVGSNNKTIGVDGDRPSQTDVSIDPTNPAGSDGRISIVYSDATTTFDDASTDGEKAVSGFTDRKSVV